MESIISGIISGVIASGIISIVMFAMKPNIIISDCIAVHPTDGKYYIKVVNCSRFHLLDVNYTLRRCTQYGDEIMEVEEIPPVKSLMRTIDKYDGMSPDHSYAVRFSYDIAPLEPLDENEHLEFTLSARHSFTNAVACLKVGYRPEDIKLGQFQSRKSTVVLHPKG